MIRLFDRSFSGKKNILIILSDLFGISVVKALRICTYVGLNPHNTLGIIKRSKLNYLESVVSRFFLVERPLRREYLVNLDQKIKKGCYQGIRLKQGLPARGQRTHTNAKTAKRKKMFKLI
jgi:small subunit ribosomal protein S13